MKVHLICWCAFFVISHLLHFHEASTSTNFKIQEFAPLALGHYQGNLENAELLFIHYELAHSLVAVKFAANITDGCNLSNITVNLRHKGLPIVNLNNATYPNDTWIHRPVDYEMNFLSDGQYNTISINSSKSSSLFGTAFILDDTARIQQQGLTKLCETLLWGRVESTVPDANSSPRISQDGCMLKRADTSKNVTHLTRKSYGGSLTTNWILDDQENYNASESSDLSLTLRVSEPPTLFSWLVLSPLDVGGTLFIEQKLKSNNTSTSVIGCVTYGSPDCGSDSYNFTVNHSLEEENSSKVFIPYPLEGEWFISLKTKCSSLKYSECETNVSLVVEISICACQEESCGPNGRCSRYFSAGLIYSACACSNGYSGWACSDDSNALSYSVLIASVLLLTLSNLFFIPSIVLAYRCKYYPQCLIYLSAMFFSTFYHACDQNDYCLMKYSALQYGDFFSALTSVWETALIVGHPSISDTFLNTLSLAGTVVIAVSVHYNSSSIVSLIIPIAAGVILIAVSWIIHSREEKSCYPGRRYYLTAVAPCILFAISGFVCFAFLETEKNYYYVHSIWHVSIALSIVFILPRNLDRKPRRISM